MKKKTVMITGFIVAVVCGTGLDRAQGAPEPVKELASTKEKTTSNESSKGKERNLRTSPDDYLLQQWDIPGVMPVFTGAHFPGGYYRGLSIYYRGPGDDKATKKKGPPYFKRRPKGLPLSPFAVLN